MLTFHLSKQADLMFMIANAHTPYDPILLNEIEETFASMEEDLKELDRILHGDKTVILDEPLYEIEGNK